MSVALFDGAVGCVCTTMELSNISMLSTQTKKKSYLEVQLSMPKSKIKKLKKVKYISGTHQLGNTLPSSEFSSISLKNSSTERPMLMGGSSG
jgi:hypothetical protein